MRAIVTSEHRFACTPDGAVWTQAAFAYPFWKRYLSVFEQVRVAARVQHVQSIDHDWRRADGENVLFAPLPYYVGPLQYLMQMGHLKHAAKKAIGLDDAVILRVSSQIATSIVPLLRRMDRPYGVEVVGDPYDVFAPGAVKHPFRPVFRWWFTGQLKHQCAAACAAAYVTEQALQRRYPNPSYAVGVSDVELPKAAFLSAPRPPTKPGQVVNLVTVGSLAQLYKAPDVLIDAVAACTQAGLDLHLALIGDGKHRSELEARVIALGLADRIRFLGQLTAGDAVRAHLDQADLFILPSRTEGLPRAMIEAMARGLPCIGSSVGGIPELLPCEDLIPPGDVAALAQKIQEVATNPQRMAGMSVRNLQTSRAYREDILSARRIAFYRHVKQQTEAWLTRRGRV